MRSPKQWLVGTSVIGGVVIVAYSCCMQKRGDLAPVPTLVDAQECPMDDPTTGDTLRLPGTITFVPEFHDCQRFIVRRRTWFSTSREYSALHAIWVRDRLDTVSFPVSLSGIIPPSADSIGLPDVEQGVSYRVAGSEFRTGPFGLNAWITTALGDTVVVASGQQTPSGVAVALIWSDGPYEPLGIEPGFNCLYLHLSPTWQGLMVPVGEDQKACFENVDPQNVSGRPLHVLRTINAKFTADDYPPVARWDWDPRSRQYYVGIRCAAAWCEIRSSENVGSSASQTAGGRTREIKGWYDQQYLAVRTADNRQWPTKILGTLYPDPGLHDLLASPSGFPKDKWVRVAYVEIGVGTEGEAPTDEQAVYETKFGFGFGVTSTISYCLPTNQDPAKCPGLGTPPLCPGEGERSYWAMIETPNKPPRYRCVTYTNHWMQMPGVVRWRWLANDETTWVSCPNGCCKVS